MFSDTINFKTFLSVWKKFPESGPTPVSFAKIAWELLRDKKIYIYLDPVELDDPIILAYQLPKGRKVLLLENPTKNVKSKI